MLLTLMAPPWDFTIPCATNRPIGFLAGFFVVNTASNILFSIQGCIPWPYRKGKFDVFTGQSPVPGSVFSLMLVLEAQSSDPLLFPWRARFGAEFINTCWIGWVA